MYIVHTYTYDVVVTQTQFLQYNLSHASLMEQGEKEYPNCGWVSWIEMIWDSGEEGT